MFELPNGSHSVLDIQNTFKYIIKPHDTLVNKPPVQIYVNKNHNRVPFKTKSGYYLELLTPKTMKLLGSTEKIIAKEKNGENVLQLEITKIVLVHCNVLNSQYQHDSRVLPIFAPSN